MGWNSSPVFGLLGWALLARSGAGCGSLAGSAGVGAVADLVPGGGPFLSPREGTLAGGAGFLGERGFLVGHLSCQGDVAEEVAGLGVDEGDAVGAAAL
jgi:hypothetical protein